MDIERKIAEMKRKAEELADEAADLHGFAPRSTAPEHGSVGDVDRPNPQA